MSDDDELEREFRLPDLAMQSMQSLLEATRVGFERERELRLTAEAALAKANTRADRAEAGLAKRTKDHEREVLAWGDRWREEILPKMDSMTNRLEAAKEELAGAAAMRDAIELRCSEFRAWATSSSAVDELVSRRAVEADLTEDLDAILGASDAGAAMLREMDALMRERDKFKQQGYERRSNERRDRVALRGLSAALSDAGDVPVPADGDMAGYEREVRKIVAERDRLRAEVARLGGGKPPAPAAPAQVARTDAKSGT